MLRCDNLILHCLDYRIQSAIDDWIRNQGMVGNIDRVAVAGSCRTLEMAMRNVGAGCRIHSVKHLILTQHHDCRAYGGTEAFRNAEEERDKLIEDMQLLAAEARRSFPEIKVTKLFIHGSGDEWRFVEV